MRRLELQAVRINEQMIVQRALRKHEEADQWLRERGLELKFTGRFPDWFKELVRVFGLKQGSASKYADGIALKGESHFYRHGRRWPVGLNPADGEANRRARLERVGATLGGA